MARKSSKAAILDAAERVVMRQGLKSATVEAVAAEAGVSKGGLFYHFASKQDLLVQLIDRHMEKYRELRDKLILELPEGRSRKLKATLLASLTQPVRQSENLPNILALLDDVMLREKIYQVKRQLLREISEDTSTPERAALAMMAADGLWMSDMYGAPLFTDEFKQKVVNELLRIIDDFCQTA